MIDIKTE